MGLKWQRLGLAHKAQEINMLSSVENNDTKN